MAVPKSVPKPQSVEFTKAVCKKNTSKTGRNVSLKKNETILSCGFSGKYRCFGGFEDNIMWAFSKNIYALVDLGTIP